MRLLILMACVASAVLAGPGTILRPELNSHWENFKTTYNKNYEGGEESLRYYQIQIQQPQQQKTSSSSSL